MAPQFVKPYVKTNEHDVADAEAICEAVTRPIMRFVPIKTVDQQVGEMEVRIQEWHRSSDLSRKLEKIPGIGPITASALVAPIGDAKNFANGRQPAAWFGVVPKQHSTGGKVNLLGISKRGDTYLRNVLIHGAYRTGWRRGGRQGSMPQENPPIA